jgi:hypothetical protein
MPSLLLALIVVAAPIDDIAGPPGDPVTAPKLRPVLEITRDVNELIRREVRLQTDSERAAAAVEMTTLYREIKRDPRLVVTDSLKEAKHRLWSKLTRTKKDILAKMKREGRRNDTMTDEEVLALADMEFVAQSLADHLAFAGSTLGGPAAVFAQSSSGSGAMGGAAGSFDYGPELVDLIQRTIVPDFWDVNGGPGTIVYYRPLMCLVVRATSDVHHRLGGVLGALGGAR